jgi:hypothetical protein
MNWNLANSLEELTICPMCNKELDIGQIQVYPSGRKKTKCSCGCRMYESNEKLSYFVPPSSIKTNVMKFKGYEQYVAN